MHLNIQNIHSFFRISNLWKPATGAECVHSQLGSLVDLEWNIKEGIMKVSKSQNQNQKISYTKDQQLGVQNIRGVKFHHGSKCPLLNKDIKLNAQKYMKPCASVMLFNKKTNQFLATQRSPQLRTFPNAWVLPGGHLDPGQTIFQGGIRQCQQQVGLPKGFNLKYPQQNNIMLWQSVFTQQGSVKGCALCVFFMVQCEQFDVKVQPRQVSQHRWKNINDSSQQTLYNSTTKVGYAQGHLKYLSMVRQNFKQINSKI